MRTIIITLCIAILVIAGFSCKKADNKEENKIQDKVTDMEEKKPDTPKENPSKVKEETPALKEGSSPAEEKTVSEWDKIRDKLIKDIAGKQGHLEFKAWLEKQEKPDKTEIANEQLILNALDNKFSGDFRLASIGAVLNHQSWHLIENNRRFDVADAMVRKGLELDGDECDYLDTLAELQFRKGQFEEAIKTINKALAQKTDRGKPMGGGKRSYLEDQLKKFQKALAEKK